MREQPAFGRRLKALRAERGLSQSALAGEEISTGYLSRLESGARQPTDRVITYLARQLGVEPSAFEEAPHSGSLAQALSLAMSSDSDEATENLIAVLERADGEDAILRWQALWLASVHWRQRGERGEEQTCLEELVRIADEQALPELQCRARSHLARSLRSTGEVSRAISIAVDAHRLAKNARLSVSDTGGALLTLVSVEAEAGRLPDARAHADELAELMEGRSGVLAAEALWSVATVRFRQGDHEVAMTYLERAMQELESRVDLTLWLRLRLAAASLCLQITPPRTSHCREYLEAAAGALSLVGTPVLCQELLTLQTHLAFEEGRFAAARAAYDELSGHDLRLSYRDRIRLHILNCRLMLRERREEEAIRRLKELGEEARQESNIDLAAEIWRILAEALEDVHRDRPVRRGRSAAKK
ncbi:helix-turn-helix domain-containing protein [Streptomyces noursei]|uniref:DNA-binding protein n=1 Tax=Streptomyces noursei TaxID=1971 RepID=A0A2N8PGQ4_STRNR|nr:helix-turn-helix transcriptional regulator [Streptomyces noursei]PNE40225.1 DNA-binding protein [Streptomyces noursei]